MRNLSRKRPKIDDPDLTFSFELRFQRNKRLNCVFHGIWEQCNGPKRKISRQERRNENLLSRNGMFHNLR
jgi:hypothetical protein